MLTHVLKILIGISFGLACGWVLSPVLAVFKAEAVGLVLLFYGLVIAGACALCLQARSLRHALGRGFLMLGVGCFTFPVSSLILSWIFTTDMVAAQPYADQSYMAAGMGLFAAIFVGISAVISFAFGGVFLALGFGLVLWGKVE